MNIKNDKLAWLISCYLLEMGYVPDENYEGVLNWLELSTNIKSIEFDVAKYDESILYCGSAWDYAVKQSEIWERMNIKLVQFNYVWCALESIVDIQLDERTISNIGKINATCVWLKENMLISDIPKQYIEIYTALIEQLRFISQFEKDLEKLGISENNIYPNKECANETGAGLLVVYKIRNKFAHGSFKMPAPYDDEWSENDIVTPELIDLATALVLYSIVMLLIIGCKKFDEIVDDYIYCESMVGKKPSEFLRTLCDLL